MSVSSEATDMMLRMTLETVEVLARISGDSAIRVTKLLYKILSEQQKTAGSIRLTNMLKSGTPLKVYTVRDEQLKTFCNEAKKYGILYCVLKDRDAKDGITDIMVRADDASKVARVFERFGLANINIADIMSDITEKELVVGKEDPSKGNPTTARTTKSRQYVPIFEIIGAENQDRSDKKPSVKAELKEIRKEMEEKKETKPKTRTRKAKEREDI